MNPPNYSRRAVAALVVSSDMLGSALLGAALELLGYRAVFPHRDESAADALRRAKPRVVLLDAAEDHLNDNAVLGPAMMTGAQLVFFGTAEQVRDIRVAAGRYNASLLTLPADAEKLAKVLRPPPLTGQVRPTD